MRRRRVGPVLMEIADAIEGIEAHTTGKSFAEFENDWLLRLATQRALEIISEACRHVPDEFTAHAPDIPWTKIRGIGNVLRHEYHRIADEVIWAVVTENIGPLKRAIAVITAHVDEDDQRSPK